MKIKEDYVITIKLWDDNGMNHSMANTFIQHFTVTVEYDTEKENLTDVYGYLETVADHYQSAYIAKGFALRGTDVDISPSYQILRD